MTGAAIDVLTAALKHDLLAGPAAEAFAKSFGKAPPQMARRDLRRFKEMIELTRV